MYESDDKWFEFSKINIFETELLIMRKMIDTINNGFFIRQVTLVRGLAQLFLVEMVFLNYQQTIYLYNFKKQKKHTLAVSFC